MDNQDKVAGQGIVETHLPNLWSRASTVTFPPDQVGFMNTPPCWA